MNESIEENELIAPMSKLIKDSQKKVNLEYKKTCKIKSSLINIEKESYNAREQ